MSRELQQIGCPPYCLGSYWGAPTIPQAGLAPARFTAPFHGALNNPALDRRPEAAAAEDLAGGVEAGGAHHAAAGVSGGAA